MTTDDAPRWHYVITLQAGAVPPILLSTQHGFFDGYVDEEQAFTDVWDEACRRLTKKTKKTWERETTTVLFYRLERTTR